MFNQSVPKRPLSSSNTVLQFGRGKRFEYNRQATVFTMIEYQVEKYPDNIAIRFQRQQLTYKQFNERANQFAHYLVKAGVKPGANVAIYLEPSIELAISILAVLKAGGCYVPLDINYPIERLNCMLEDSAAVLLLTQSKLTHKLNDANIKIIEIDGQAKSIKKEKLTNLENLATGEDSAYIIYTSGSTGKPKGIAVHHSAINNHMTWMQDYFEFNFTDVVLLKTPLSFDPSVWEFFLPLCIGAQLVIAPTRAYLDPESLIKLIDQYKITTIQFVPSLLHAFLKHKKVNSCHSLKRVFVGGESLGIETKKNVF